MRKNIALLLSGIIAFLAGYSQTFQSINKDSLAKHIMILASDSFQGRKPFTIGETRSVDYIQNVYKYLGLEPGNGDSYVQDVPMVSIKPDTITPLKVESPNGNFELQSFTDFVAWTERTDPVESFNNDEVVFAGYGVVAPEYNWNDYANLDVKGKIVMVMVNDPGFGNGDTTLFQGIRETYYGRWTYKYEEAARQGAKGCLIIHNTAAASYPFSVIQNSNTGAKLHLDNRSNKDYQLAIQGWIPEQTALKLLQAAGKDSSLLKSADIRGFKGTSLNIRLSVTVKSEIEYKLSKNVIAKITGSKHPNEYIIYSAHWDHFGIGKPDNKGDSIYNGAVDNASGVAALLDVARAFKNLPTPPDRSIIFIATTGEEQGLLGATYYALHPIYPLAKTVADINFDMMNCFDRTKDISIDGPGESELDDYLQKEAESKGRYLGAESHPEAGHFFRADHFAFAKVGVPAFNTSAGIDDITNGKAYGKKLKDDYYTYNYHRPSDNYDPKAWNLAGAAEDIELLFQVGKKLAFSNAWVQWKPTSEFKAIREKSL